MSTDEDTIKETATHIEVMFTCNACGLTKSRVMVRKRVDGEDLMSWMEEVRKQCGRAHALRSLLCEESKADLYLPVPEGDKVGGSVHKGPLSEEEKIAINKVLEKPR